MDGRTHTGSEPQHRADVSGNLRLKKSYSHLHGLAEMFGALNVSNGWKTDLSYR
jgi:hypothetical protein